MIPDFKRCIQRDPMSFDGKVSFTEELRYLEQSEEFFEIHCELIEWGRWARASTTDPLGNGLKAQGIWSLPGEYDPGTDTEATPEAPRVPINIKRVKELDARMSRQDFPALWRKVLKINYAFGLPEYQRPEEARVGENLFLESLSGALERLMDQ